MEYQEELVLMAKMVINSGKFASSDKFYCYSHKAILEAWA